MDITFKAKHYREITMNQLTDIIAHQTVMTTFLIQHMAAGNEDRTNDLFEKFKEAKKVALDQLYDHMFTKYGSVDIETPKQKINI